MNTTVSPYTYYRVFGALLLLLVLTVGVAYIDLGPFNVVVALAIALVKATLVALFFMHLRYDSPLVRFFACLGLLWFVLLFGGTLHDYLSRLNVPVFPAW